MRFVKMATFLNSLLSLKTEVLRPAAAMLFCKTLSERGPWPPSVGAVFFVDTPVSTIITVNRAGWVGVDLLVPCHTFIWNDPVSVDQLISPGCVQTRQLCGHISSKSTLHSLTSGHMKQLCLYWELHCLSYSFKKKKKKSFVFVSCNPSCPVVCADNSG